MDINNDQLAKVFKALYLAEKTRDSSAEYLRDGKPRCVIAHLYVMEGGSVEELAKVDAGESHDRDIFSFLNYPQEMLHNLQEKSDAMHSLNELLTILFWEFSVPQKEFYRFLCEHNGVTFDDNLSDLDYHFLILPFLE